MNTDPMNSEGTSTETHSGDRKPEWARQRPSTTVSQRQRPIIEETKKLAAKDPEAALEQQLSSPEFVEFRTEMALNFVDNVELPPPGERIPGWSVVPQNVAREVGFRGSERGLEGTGDPWEDLEPDEPQPPSAAINGNIIASFVDGVNGQQKDDVLASTLFAQLAANAKFNRTADPFNWSNRYSNVLENIAWVVPNSQFRKYEAKQSRFTMDEVVIKMLAAILTQEANAILTESIEAVKALRDDSSALVIFERNAAKVENGNFMIEPAGVSPTGVVTLKLGSFAFRTTETVTKVLWFRFRGGPATKVAINRNTLVLNQQVYDHVRQDILNRIISYIKDYTRVVELAGEPGQFTEAPSFGSASGWASLR